MNTIGFFFVQLAITTLVASLITIYLRPYLYKILVDLCTTEDRAQFWTKFSNILLIGMPVVFALKFTPLATESTEMFFEIMSKLGSNIFGFLFALVCIGVIVSFFALVAPKNKLTETK